MLAMAEQVAQRLGQSRPVKLAVLCSVPVHYRVPLYQRIAADPRIDFTAIFASSAGLRAGELGYGRPSRWDVNLLSGHDTKFLSRADRNEVGGFFSLRDRDVVGVVLRERFDALWLHGYNHATYLMAAVCQRARRAPLLYREEQTLLHGRAPVKAFAKQIGLRALFRGTTALYIGTQNRRWFEHYGVPKERLYFTPYSVDNEALQDSARELMARKTALRKSFGIGPDAGPVILTVARLIPKKQPLFLLEAFRRVRKERKCVLLIAGAGELEQEMRRAAADIPDVHLAGFVEQSRIGEVYAAADIFALASRYHETWGVVVNEAMNFSLPIVVTNKVGSAIDLVKPDENGFIVSADDPSELTHALSTLVRSADMRARFGAASARIINDWSPDRTAAGVIEAVAASVGPERWRAATPLDQ